MVLAAKFSPFDSPTFCSQIITPTCNTTLAYIDTVNAETRPFLQLLVKTPFFKYFKLNFEKECRFWNPQHSCITPNCAVEVLLPEQFNWLHVTDENLKPSKLGKLNVLPTGDVTEPETCEDLDYCHIDDDHHCDFINLLDNPERFTGYGGQQSFDVWKAIYSENCFPNTNPMSMTAGSEPESCVEKNLFYRVILGMHASIAVHLSNEYLDSETGTFYPDLKTFMDRVGRFSDRLLNIYFNYALVSQAVVRLSEILPLTEFVQNGGADSESKFLSSDEIVEQQQYTELLDNIVPNLAANTLFDSSSLFNPENVAPELKNEFRARFKNVSAIMDCVGCDRCRMWGKLQTIGYGTALKILFESDDENRLHLLKFRRIELVGLFNTLDRLLKLIEAINDFKQMYLKHLADVELGVAKPGEYEIKQDSRKGIEFPFQDLPFKKEAADSIKRVPPKKNVRPQAPKDTIKKPTTKSTFWDELKLGFDEVFEALKFVLNSYRLFPSLVFKLVLVHLNNYWNMFIGNKQYVYYDPHEFFSTATAATSTPVV